MQVERASSALAAAGYVFMKSEEWPLHRDDPRAWSSLAQSWNRLVTDPYVKPGDGFRSRRFGKFVVDARGAMAIRPLEDCSFFQPSSINRYAGGLQRVFSPLEPAVRNSSVLGTLMRACLRAIHGSGTAHPQQWRINVHQFRIHCDRAVTGHATPEGLHRDGHDFISMHLIDRAGVVGGVSSVCDGGGRPLLEVTLSQPMDSFLIDDRALMHAVTPIRSAGDAPGHRDMLVIDYNPGE